MSSPTSRGPECLDDATVMAFLDGELPKEARARVDAHVDGCTACLALLAVLGRSEPRETPQGPEGPEGPERYEIRQELGIGGMGLVFEAFDSVLGRDVALKCVRPGREGEAAARRFEREMALTARLQHPSIIPVYDAGFFPDGSHYFAMRLVEGQTLDAAIEQASSFDERMALIPSVRRACEAVAFAHQQSVIHRDLKPANVLLGPFGETVVLDWGLAKHLGEDEVEGESLHGDADAESMTRPGAVMGTRGYIAPEVERGEGADARSDVFSLGKVLAQLVPTERETNARREVRADLRSIVERAISEDPASRYASAQELCEDLRRFEAGQRVRARDYSLRSRVRRFVRRYRTPLLLSASFVAVGVLVGVGVASLHATDGAQPCTGAQEALVGVWDPQRRAQVEAAFAALHRPFADRAASRIVDTLDARGDAWIRMHTEACEATARGEQSSSMLDLRMRCLMRAASEMRSTVEVLADADLAVARKADSVVTELSPLSRCADGKALEEGTEPPSARDEASVEAARAGLDKADAQRLAGHYEDAEASLEEARALVEAVEYRPILTELALGEGMLHDSRDDFEAALADFGTVMRIGAAQRQWPEVRVAAVAAMGLMGDGLFEPEQALRYRAIAEGLSKGNPRTEVDFRLELGAVYFAAGRFAEGEVEVRSGLATAETLDDPLWVASAQKVLATGLLAKGEPAGAEALLREALETSRRILGEDHPRTAEAQVSLAEALASRGEDAGAEADLRAAIEVLESTMGPKHHEVAEARTLLGMALYRQGRHQASEAQMRTVVEIVEDSLGSTHPRYALAHYSLGFPLLAQGKFEEAEAAFRTAMAGTVANLGEEHPLVLSVRTGLASALSEAGKLAESESEFRTVLAALEGTPPTNVSYAVTRSNFAELLTRRGKLEEAEAEYRAVIEALEDQGHFVVPQMKASLARLLLETDRGALALPLAEQAWVEHGADGVAPENRARTGFILARILWVVKPRQRARARTLAQDAAASYGRASAAHEPSRKEVEAWLAQR